MRKIAAQHITASHLHTFTITFPVNMLVKFLTTTTWKSDELISWKETFGLCEGRAEQAVLWNLWKVVYGLRRQQSRV